MFWLFMYASKYIFSSTLVKCRQNFLIFFRGGRYSKFDFLATKFSRNTSVFIVERRVQNEHFGFQITNLSPHRQNK